MGETDEPRDPLSVSPEVVSTDASGERAARAPRKRNERMGERPRGDRHDESGTDNRSAGRGSESTAERPDEAPRAPRAVDPGGDAVNDDTSHEALDRIEASQDGDGSSGEQLTDGERRGRSRRRRGRRDRSDERNGDSTSPQRSAEESARQHADAGHQRADAGRDDAEAKSGEPAESLPAHSALAAGSAIAAMPAVADRDESGRAATELAEQSFATNEDLPAGIPSTRDLFQAAPVSQPSGPESRASQPQPSADVESRRKEEPRPVAPRQEAPRQAAPRAEPDKPEMAQAPEEPQAPAVPQAPEPVAAILPEEELTSVVASAGLEWVQTTHTAIDTMPAAATVAAPRPRRQRKPKSPVVAAPLQQVETQPGDDETA